MMSWRNCAKAILIAKREQVCSLCTLSSPQYPAWMYLRLCLLCSSPFYSLESSHISYNLRTMDAT